VADFTGTGGWLRRNPHPLTPDVSGTCQQVLGQNQGVKFDVVGAIEQVATIAAGPSVKVRSFLRKTYGRGRWLKGVATVRLPNGILRRVELHWV